MKQTVGALLAAAGLVAASLGFLANSPASPAEAQASLTARAFVLVVARDGVFTANSNLPPADPSYCPSGNPPSVPNSVYGLLTIGGSPAPTGTVVQVVLDGKRGPARFVSAPGGYRVDFAVGGPSCPNRVGASIGVLVNGQVFPWNMTVAASGTGPQGQFDIAVP